jgi:F-type H+-transporting ATPase subunit delta
LDEIVAIYGRVADQDSGVAEAVVTSAFELNEDDRRNLDAQVAKMAGSKVRISYLRDKELLGGVIVKIGSTVYDGSLRGQLQQLKQTLVSA